MVYDVICWIGWCLLMTEKAVSGDFRMIAWGISYDSGGDLASLNMIGWFFERPMGLF